MRTLLLGLVSWSAFAWSVTSGPIKSDITHTSVRLHWVTDASVQSRWAWDTVSHAGGTWTDYPNKYTGSLNLRVHSTYIAGLAANALYYLRLCGYDGSSTICAAESTVTTLPQPGTHPQPAILPTSTVDTTMPSCANGMLHCVGGNPVTATVGSDCDDPATGLVALYNAASWGDTIIVPKTTVCRNYFSLPAKAAHDGTKWIIIRTDDLAGLPATGTRVQASDSSHMPVFQQTIFGFNSNVSGLGNCWPGGYHWDTASTTPGWYMKKCAVASSGSVSGISGNSSGRDYDVTTSASVTVAVDQWGYMTGVGGIPKANGTFQVTSVTDSQHFHVLMVNGYANPTGQTYTSGGTLDLFDFADVPKQSYTGASPSSSCATGEWAYSNQTPAGGSLTGNIAVGVVTQTSYSSGRVWRCTATNTWTREVIYPFVGQPKAAITAIVDVSGAHHLRFIGLHFSHEPVPSDTLLNRGGPLISSGWIQGGSAPAVYFFSDNTSHHIILDRCLVERGWDAKGDMSLRLDGDYVAVVDTRVQTSGNWFGAEERGGGQDNLAGDGLSLWWGGPKLLRNNHVEHYGIGAHFNDGAAGAGAAVGLHDITIERNLFTLDFANIHQAPGSTTAKYTSLRQLLEFKRGMRVNINGNIFRRNFQNVAQGAAIALSDIYTGDSAACLITYSGSNLLCQAITPIDVSVGDWVNFSGAPNDLYQVSAVADASHFTVANGPASLSFSFVGVVTGNDGVYDVSITNNTFDLVPTGVVEVGWDHDNCCVAVRPQRITIRNNIVKNLGPGGDGSGSLSVPEGEKWNFSGGGGYFTTVWGGVADLIYEHNTYYLFNRQGGIFDGYATLINEVPGDGTTLENEGLRWANNLYWISNVTEPFKDITLGDNGQHMIERFFLSPYIATKNVIVRSGGDPGGYPSGNRFIAYAGATSPFTNPSAGDFSLTPGGIGASAYTCFSNAGDCTTDGADSGVDMTALTAAQGGLDCATLTFNPTSRNSPAAGDSGSIGVTAPVQTCLWTASSAAPWLTITGGGAGTGNGTIDWAAAANSGAARSATISAAGAVFTDSQAASSCAGLAFDPTSHNSPAAGDSGSINVTVTDQTCSWTAVPSASWLNITSGGSGTGNGVITWTVSSNAGIPRAASITVLSAAFTAMQAGAVVGQGSAMSAVSIRGGTIQ